MEKFKTIDEYLTQFPKETQIILQKIRGIIAEVAPDATEKISYGMPTFYLKGNLVHFAGWDSHIGFYPGGSALADFEQEIAGYKHAKGSVQFPLSKPIPYDLIEKITEYRVQQNNVQS